MGAPAVREENEMKKKKSDPNRRAGGIQHLGYEFNVEGTGLIPILTAKRNLVKF